MRPGPLIAACVGSVALLTACQPTLTLMSAPLPDASAAQISTPGLQAQDAPIDQPIVVEVEDGRLLDVAVTHEGKAIEGEFSPDGRAWRSTDKDFAFSTTYDIQATAVDSRGNTTSVDEQMTTLTPDALVKPTFDLTYGTEWGVGMPIIVNFDEPIKDKAAAEERMIVRTSQPVEGAWYWVSNTEAIYRPKYYWPGKTDIEVDVDLKGVEVAPGVYGKDSVKQRFRTFDSVVLKADAETLMLDVWRNDEVINSIPVTMGMDGYETLTGTKLIISQERTRIMDNATAGVSEDDPEHYRVEVDYAMRLTWHGEFLHASPWAAGAWGNVRMSHGCTSMSTEDAAWLFDITHIGDPVEITGTPLQQNPGNGITVWNISWKDWVKESALGERLTEPLLKNA